MRFHAGRQCVLPRVSERRVAEIVRQRDGFDEVFVERQRARNRAPELSDLERMREPGAVQIALVVDEDLRLVDEAPERRAMHDAVTVALMLAARRRGKLLKPPAA